jgi:hypothetical protein
LVEHSARTSTPPESTLANTVAFSTVVQAARCYSNQNHRLLDDQETAFCLFSSAFHCSASPAWGTNLRTGRRETCWLGYDPSVNRSSISKLPLVRDVLYDPGGLRASGLAFPGHRKL